MMFARYRLSCLSALLVISCTTTGRYLQGDGKVVESATFTGTFGKVLEATLEAVGSANLKVNQQLRIDNAAYRIYAGDDKTPGGLGPVRLLIEDIGGDDFAVTIRAPDVTEYPDGRRLARGILDRIKSRLN